jgi:hypothetical protein
LREARRAANLDQVLDAYADAQASAVPVPHVDRASRRVLLSRETVTPTQIVGMLLAISGVVFINWR